MLELREVVGNSAGEAAPEHLSHETLITIDDPNVIATIHQNNLAPTEHSI